MVTSKLPSAAGHPDVSTLVDSDRIAITDPAMLRIVISVLSRFLGDSSNCASWSYSLGCLLRDYASTDIVRPRALSPAPHPSVVDVVVRTGKASLKRVGLTKYDVSEMWTRRFSEFGCEARLPADVIDALVPAELWRVVASMLLDGPDLSAERFNRSLHAWADPERSGDDQRPSKGSLERRAASFSRLQRVVVEIHQEGEGDPLLSAWYSVGSKKRLPEGGPSSRPGATAAPRELVRRAYARALKRVRERFGTDDLEALAEAFGEMTPAQLRGGLREIRALAMIVVFAVLGARLGAVTRIRVCDLLADHEGPRADGLASGPAIRLFPEKTWDPREASIKHLPISCAHVLIAYRAYIAAVSKHEIPEDAPFWISSCAAPTVALTECTIHDLVAGRPPRPNVGGVRALIPLELPQGLPECATAEERHVEYMKRFQGVPPHSIRSTATQWIRSDRMESWLDEHEIDDERVLIADALIDHANPATDAQGYAGGKKRNDQERLSAVAIAALWDFLSTDAGARKVPDAERYRRELRKFVAVDAKIEQLLLRIDEMDELILASDPDDDEADFANRQADELDRQIRELRAVRRDATKLLKALRSDHSTWVAWESAEAPPTLDVIDVQLAGASSEVDGLPPAVRNYFTPSEVAQLADVTPQTLRNWMAGKHLPEDPARRPWEPDAIPVDESCGVRYRKIAARGVNPTFTSTAANRREAALILSRPPATASGRPWPAEYQSNVTWPKEGSS